MDTFRKPDLSAPRYRLKKKNIIDDEYYKNFQKKYPDNKDISLSQLKKIVKAANTEFWKLVIENRDGIELPENLGHIFIGSCYNIQKENIDYGKSIKYNTKVTHKNYDTDGHVSKIFYTNYSPKYKIKYRKIWSFAAGRYFKRAVKDAFKDNWKKYMLVDNTLKISNLYKQKRTADYLKSKASKEYGFYDEFDMN